MTLRKVITVPNDVLRQKAHKVKKFDKDLSLLIDDMIDSGWTFTVASALLNQADCSAVYPMALALNSPRMD